MASKCPKCHQIVEDDVICCANLQYTWKCKACGKLSTGFVVPYGRCYLCGGENEVVEAYKADDPQTLKVIEEAVQYELDMYHFYKLGMAQTKNPQLKVVLEELLHKEEDHLEELNEKYHVHLEPNMQEELPSLSQWIFEGIDFDDDSHVVAVYDKAIEMERRTRDHFKARAESLPPGKEREIYRELAAEEEDHVAVLETEREQFSDDD